MEKQFTAEPRRITVGELKSLLDAGADLTILDVRADDAYNASQEKIPGAMRIPPNDIAPAASLPRDRLVVAYCT